MSLSASHIPLSLRAAAQRLRWPWPAALLWAACWGVFRLGQQSGLGASGAFLLALGLGAAGALAAARWRASVSRRLMLVGGFPALLLASGSAAGLPAWIWLLPVALLLSAYPMRAWRDAPVFPTPPDALQGLETHIALPAGARILDAGCGLGHGLRALRAVYPQAQLQGIEWSWPLRLWTALRCPWARVTRGDMWAQPWLGLDLVYLFQRPESMARAWTKARQELPGGAWLVSLEFPVPDTEATAVLQRTGARTVWIYRLPLHGAQAQVGKVASDMQNKKHDPFAAPTPEAQRRHPFKKRVSTCL